MRKKLKQDQINEIIKLYQNGVKPKEIAKQFEIYNGSVVRIIRKNNIARTNLIKLTDEQINIIVKKYVAGISSEIIANEMGIDGTTVCRVLKRNGIKIRPSTENKRRYKVNDTLFETIDTEEKAYFLGMMYSDGNLHYRRGAMKISLKEDDTEILEKLSNIIYGFKKITYDKKKDTGKIYPILSFYSKKMHADLCKLGCVPNKCFKIGFPKEHIPFSIMNHFIRGFFDGDGCICITSNNRSIIDITANIDFIVGLVDFLHKNTNIVCGKISQRHENTNTRSFQIGNIDNVKKFVEYIYKDATIYMNRKRQKSLASLEQISNKKAYDINRYGTTYMPEINGKKLTRSVVKNMTAEEINDAIQTVFDFYRTNGFPYSILSNDELYKDFLALRKMDPNIIVEKDNIIQAFQQVGINTFKHFSPHFYEVNRGWGKKLSMLETFENDKLLFATIKNRLSQGFNITGNMIKQGLANSKLAFKASIFNPMIAKYIYSQHTKENDIIYDYSMGFGQRLLAALSLPYHIKYIGVDPYSKSVIANQNIYDFFNKNIITLNKEIDIIQSGSEKYCDPQYIGKVNLAFSSPPYFNMEKYDDSQDQAAYTEDYLSFINEWWKNTVENIKQLLIPNGYFILNMKEEINGFDILEDMSNIILATGFKKTHTYQMRLSRNSIFGNKMDRIKYEPIVVFQKL